MDYETRLNKYKEEVTGLSIDELLEDYVAFSNRFAESLDKRYSEFKKVAYNEIKRRCK